MDETVGPHHTGSVVTASPSPPQPSSSHPSHSSEDQARDAPARGCGAPPQRLWSRDFSLFFAARGVAKLGDAMLPIALSAGLIQYGYGAGGIGAALAALSVCFAGFVVFGGVFCDRFDTRALMVGADLVRVCTQSVASALFLTGRVELWQVCVIGAVNGLAAGMFQPGIASTIPRVARDVQGANGLVRTAESLAMLAGPALAGLLVALTSAGGVLAAHAGTYALSALCLLLLRLPRGTGTAANPTGGGGSRSGSREGGGGGGRRGATSYRADLAEGWREFRARSWMWGVIVIWMVFMLASWGPLVPLTAAQLIPSAGARVYGFVNSALGAGTALGGLLALRIRPRFPLRAGAVALLGSAASPPRWEPGYRWRNCCRLRPSRARAWAFGA
jgi:MFS family permease